jgi:hypothetical protein
LILHRLLKFERTGDQDRQLEFVLDKIPSRGREEHHGAGNGNRNHEFTRYDFMAGLQWLHQQVENQRRRKQDSCQRGVSLELVPRSACN